MKKKYFILVYRIILLITIVIGIILNYLAKGKSMNMLLSYYTIQSNILVCILLVLEIINHFKKIKIFKEEETYQNIKGMITLIILITGLVFSIILYPYVKDWVGYRYYSSIILHYISPTMVLIDWLFFDKTSKKLSIKKNTTWLIYPVIYYFFGIIRILFIDGFIPYPFMDVKTLGFLGSASIILFMLIVFYGISILLIYLKNKLSTH